MPIKIRIQLVNLDWGQTMYVANDPEQLPHHLVGVEFLPGNVMRYKLKYYGDIEEHYFYDFECTTEPGEKTKSVVKEDGEDD